MNTRKRIYIAGCGGMLGEAVYRRFSRFADVKPTDIDLNEPWIEYADVRDYRQSWDSIESFAPDAIINLAALTDLEGCERDSENAWLTNALGAENLGLIADQLGVPYVYISTAGIFGGEKDCYTDFDTPEPRSVYAKSKHYGELFVLRHVRKHFVLRAGWMMGGGPKKDKKFINKLYCQIKSGKRILHVVEDKSGTPTYTVDFAEGMAAILESGLYGLYNQVCGGSGTRRDVAEEFVRCLGLEGKIRIEPVRSDFFAAEYFAHRPASERLVNLKLSARGLNRMRDWRTCLAEYSSAFSEDLRRAGAEVAQAF
ncbi:MAG TPA: sugar nucleotide-binding protein [Edaphobacter sp.]|uniref:SDR family oxidoreductase n=1 Tax=Edaphobacter sp. TaxID=1934404 RepID=UPI002BA46C8F|nr:sugar nucleotide-binding protein [Edaphobacter sp.]HUZ96447.1 sugar nucleotide-binding protein [Edaphobacter sp.]